MFILFHLVCIVRLIAKILSLMDDVLTLFYEEEEEGSIDDYYYDCCVRLSLSFEMSEWMSCLNSLTQ